MLDLDPTIPTAHAERLTTALAERSAAGGVIRVLVADDHPLYRQGIVRALDAAAASSSSATRATALPRCG